MNAEIEQLKAMISAGQSAGTPSLAERRANMEAMAAVFTPPDDIELETGELGGIPILRARPKTRAEGTILYFHGGGYVSGSINTHRGFAAEIARRCYAEVVSVDYRLAPEQPFPAALDDAFAAYRGLPGAPLAFMGDSAGGGLALALAMRVRDERLPLPKRLVLLCPWVDMTCTKPSFERLADLDPINDADSLRGDAEAYLSGTDPRSPLASPL
ncbi:MAG: alpha/beta hydrolase fold domain-containing protein, partial [Pacificimonas sp.]